MQKHNVCNFRQIKHHTTRLQGQINDDPRSRIIHAVMWLVFESDDRRLK